MIAAAFAKKQKLQVGGTVPPATHLYVLREEDET